ncbi:MAG: amidohydrolase [bacterium]|nr:amidohydrolase [bacterium]
MKQFLIITFICLFTTVSPAFAADFDFDSYIKSKTKEYYPEAVTLRRHLHQIPELCLQETKTARFIADYLKKCGLEVHTGIGGTGIKAILKGNKATPVIGIRADMDALPIEEATGFRFKSLHKGVMHACGHDGHMTNVLITAKILSGIKEKIPGTVVFIFQPCEEGAPGGGKTGSERMIGDGVLENPKIDAMLGLHVMPTFPVGSIGVKKGPIMANVGSVYITIKGKSSHGAFPHQGVDAIYVASTAVLQFQSLISRYKDPKEQAVLTIGKFNGGVRLNVIADKVEMEGTVRTFSFETESAIEKGMENILKGLSLSTGITYDYKFIKTSKFVKNDAVLTEKLTPLFKRMIGDSNVLPAEALTVGEDFSAYSHKVPSLFFFLGTGLEGALHSSTFAVDENIFLCGPLLFASAAVELMNCGVN